MKKKYGFLLILLFGVKCLGQVERGLIRVDDSVKVDNPVRADNPVQPYSQFVDFPDTQSVVETAADNCKDIDPQSVVSVSLAFQYRSSEGASPLHLAPLGDQARHEQFGVKGIPRVSSLKINDSYFSTGTKQQFLESLRDRLRGKKYVHFNFAGHGMVIDGKMHLLLPTVPAQFKNCLRRNEKSPWEVEYIEVNLNINPECAGIKEHTISDAELRGVFGDRMVTGIVDACHSGAFDLGQNSSMLLSSQAYELSKQDRTGGRFTNFLFKTAIESCENDLNGDQALSLYEMAHAANDKLNNSLVSFYDSASYEADASLQGIRNRGLLREDPPIPLRYAMDQRPILNVKSWMECIYPKLNKKMDCKRTFNISDSAINTAPFDLVGRDKDGKEVSCLAPVGTQFTLQEKVNLVRGRVRVSVDSLNWDCPIKEGVFPVQVLRRARDGKTEDPSVGSVR